MNESWKHKVKEVRKERSVKKPIWVSAAHHISEGITFIW